MQHGCRQPTTPMKASKSSSYLPEVKHRKITVVKTRARSSTALTARARTYARTASSLEEQPVTSKQNRRLHQYEKFDESSPEDRC